ncbi:hypothetical protein SNEBB_006452 [Seison nebaliae]|nr:hypothetical protein SNEBB_006452 [Seison nebaliae]
MRITKLSNGKIGGSIIGAIHPAVEYPYEFTKELTDNELEENNKMFLEEIERNKRRESLKKMKQSSLLSFISKTPQGKSTVGRSLQSNGSQSEDKRSNTKVQQEKRKDIESPISDQMKKRRRIVSSDEEEEMEPRRRSSIRHKIMLDFDANNENTKAEKIEEMEVDKEDLIGKYERKINFVPSDYELNEGMIEPQTTTTNVDKQFIHKIKKENLIKTNNSLVKNRFTHENFDFLKEKYLKDAMERRPDHPNYDPSTLFIPSSFIKSLTPGMTQWWKIKSENFDKLLFFKVGKFYEFYHMDAMTVVKELNLTFMKGDYAHCGFPEIMHEKYSEILVNRGYAVVRIEQTETPNMMKERLSMKAHGTRRKPHEKVVRREICRIITLGTATYSPSTSNMKLLDQDKCDEKKVEEECLPKNLDNNTYLYAMTVREIIGEKFEVTFCFIDTTIGLLKCGEVIEENSRLDNLSYYFIQCPPSEMLISKKTNLKIMESLKRFGFQVRQLNYDSDKITLDIVKNQIKRREYYQENVSYEKFENYIFDKKERYFSFKILADYLETSLIDRVTLNRLDIIEIIDGVKNDEKEKKGDKFMIIDETTLNQLEIFENSFDQSTNNTLYSMLNNCSTHMGRRLLRIWLCRPLISKELIISRSIAIQVIMSLDEENRSDFRLQLSKLPDLERLLHRINSISMKKFEDDPNSRCIMFDDRIYKKREVMDFVQLINSFELIENQLKLFFQGDNHKLLRNSKLFNELFDENNFKLFTKVLSKISNSFDHKDAIKEGVIRPRSGVDETYDESLRKIESVTEDLNEYLLKQQTIFGCNSIKYISTNISTTKNGKYLLEIPDNVAKNVHKVGDEEYEIQSTRKGFKRFYTFELRQLINRLDEAEKECNVILKDLTRIVFSTFFNKIDEFQVNWKEDNLITFFSNPNFVNQNIWTYYSSIIALLDVLLSLSEYGLKSNANSICFAEIQDENFDNRKLFIESGTYPLMAGDYIPNTITLDTKSKQLLLVTGPNMGGKSTLLRQVATTVLMAQIGCPLPAEKVVISPPIDQIFTRIGGSSGDRLMSGQSTLYIELMETSNILKRATNRSLILMDELGRGTATFDGSSIAFSVITYLINHVQCFTLFSTHYHQLVNEITNLNFKSTNLNEENRKLVWVGHMEFVYDETTGNVTFLYTLGEGAAEKSHGYNVAKMAGVPLHLLKIGYEKSNEFESDYRLISNFRQKCLKNY